MKFLTQLSTSILSISLLSISILSVSCSGNGNSGSKGAKKDSIANNIKTVKKAKKNTIFERHLTWAEKGLNGKIKFISSKHYLVSEASGKIEKEMDSKAENFFD